MFYVVGLNFQIAKPHKLQGKNFYLSNMFVFFNPSNFLYLHVVLLNSALIFPPESYFYFLYRKLRRMLSWKQKASWELQRPYALLLISLNFLKVTQLQPFAPCFTNEISMLKLLLPYMQMEWVYFALDGSPISFYILHSFCPVFGNTPLYQPLTRETNK